MFSGFLFSILSLKLPPKDLNVQERFSDEPLSIEIIWGLSTFFLLLFIFFIFVLVFSRVIKSIVKKRKIRIKKNLSEPISVYLFDEDIELAINNKNYSVVKKLFGDKYKKKGLRRSILKNEILKLHSSYSGEIAQKIELLFTIFDFHLEVGKKIKSQTWNVKANAINEAAEMNLTQYSAYILNLINYPHSIVRTEARVASVRFNRKNPFHFFHTLKYNMSEWDQIKIHNALTAYQNTDIPSMGKWLGFKNESIVVFSLKIIGFYNQFHEIDKVTGCLQNESFKIKMQALKTIGELNMEQSVPVLLDYLNDVKDNDKLLIQTLKSLAQIGLSDHTIENFEAYMELEDYDVNLSSCLAMKTSKNGIEILNNLMERVVEPKAQIIKYALYYTN